MQLSPATLSTITAVLSAQGIVASGDQLSVLLAPLTGETPPPAPLELQPGEFFLVYDQDNREHNEYRTVDELRSVMTNWYDEGDYRSRASYSNSFEEDVTIWIARREVNIDVQESVSLNFS